MSKLKILFAICAIGFPISLMGQKVTFNGVIRDSVTSNTLENVVVEIIDQNSENGGYYTAVTNIKGQFSVSIPDGSYTVILNLLGYNSSETSVNVGAGSTQEFLLSPQPIPLGEIVVTSLRVNRRIKELPTPLAVVSNYDYQKQSALTLSNVLSSEPGIAMGGDGVWATNINIRGLNENRLVTLIDGNRVETATDLTASLSMVDINDIERVEVIKGAQSSLYGTGAMGGIVSIITKDGNFSSGHYLSGNVTSGIASANELYSGHIGLNTGSKNWYLRVSGTYSDANDINTPEGVLPNSQFKSNNISAKLGVKPFANHTLKVQYQRYWANDVGIPGGSAFPGPATATYTDIGRQLISASYEISNITDKFTSLEVKYFNQYIVRDVAMIPNTVTEIPLPTGLQRVTAELVTPTGEHLTNGAQLQTTWKLSANSTLNVGVDAWARRLSTEREKFIKVEVFNTQGDLIVTNNLIRGETPNPGSTFSSTGLFIQDETRLLNERLTLVVGGRVDGVWVENDRGYDIDYLVVNGVRNDTPPNQRITFEAGNSNSISWSANVGALFNLVKDIDISANLARSFRSPSLEERFKYIDLGNMVRLGDPNLNPESGYSTDLGLRIWKPNFTLQVGVFSSWLSNMIVETPGEFIYTINTGPQQGVVDTLPALVNANVTKAMLYGFDLGFQYNVYKSLVVFGSGAFVRGEDTDADVNLPQIPPLNGRFGVRYSYPKLGSIQFTAVGASKQDKIAEGENETEGYTKFDFAISSKRIDLGFSKVQLFGGIDNLSNVSYTNHLATNRGSVSVEPSRNFYLRLNVLF